MTVALLDGVDLAGFRAGLSMPRPVIGGTDLASTADGGAGQIYIGALHVAIVREPAGGNQSAPGGPAAEAPRIIGRAVPNWAGIPLC